MSTPSNRRQAERTLRRRVGRLALGLGLLCAVAGPLACVTRPTDKLSDVGDASAGGEGALGGRASVSPVRLAPAPSEGRLPPSSLAPSPGRRLASLATDEGPLLKRGPLMKKAPAAADQGAEQRTQSLTARAAGRAFEGAPPAMPHPATWATERLKCLDCHRDGMLLGARVARPMSHVELANCTQCHVEAAHADFGPGELLAANAFAGRPTRVPPRVPHATGLRADCHACHASLAPERLPIDDPDHRGRGNPGAPPVMPHADFEEAGRDCLHCHALGDWSSGLVSHPLGLAEFVDCLSCHQDARHQGLDHMPDWEQWSRTRPYGALRVFGCLACHGAFAAPTARIGAPVAPPSAAPPPVPHEILLRSRCLSCHGELGYAGLQVDHPQRGQCLQCHLPVGDHVAAMPR